MSPHKQLQSIDLSVVILCYRSGEGILPFVEQVKEILKSKMITWELVLVGNYMPSIDDKTPEIVRKIESQDPRRVRSIAKVKKGMMGWDMRSGLELAKGQTIAVIDGDGQMPPEDLVKIYDLLLEGDFDLVKTCRQKRYDSLWRKVVSQIYNQLFNILFPGTGWNDINSKPKIMTRRAYNLLHLVSDDWFIDAEIMIQARRLNFKVGEVPTVFYKRTVDRPAFIKPIVILEFLRNLIKARIREKSKK